MNNGDKPASVLSAFNSQLPGTVSLAAALFTSTPTVPDNVLAQAFQIDTKQVDNIKTKLAPKKSRPKFHFCSVLHWQVKCMQV
ncbi:Germin-like protein 5-1, partial [Mucuna pruriens]